MKSTSPLPPPGPDPAGRTLILTRPKDTAASMTEAIRTAGVHVIEAPAIELESLVESSLDAGCLALERVRETGGWLILPSPSAIGYFLCFMDRSKVEASSLDGIRVAVIGGGGAACWAAATGRTPDYIPPDPRGAALAATLPAEPGERVLIAGSRRTRPELRQGLEHRGLLVETLALYQPRPCAEGLARLEQAGAQWPNAVVVVSSPSAVDAIADHLNTLGRWPPMSRRWVAIGPTTGARLIGRGAPAEACAIAAAPTAAAVLEILAAFPARGQTTKTEPS